MRVDGLCAQMCSMVTRSGRKVPPNERRPDDTITNSGSTALMNGMVLDVLLPWWPSLSTVDLRPAGPSFARSRPSTYLAESPSSRSEEHTSELQSRLHL